MEVPGCWREEDGFGLSRLSRRRGAATAAVSQADHHFFLFHRLSFKSSPRSLKHHTICPSVRGTTRLEPPPTVYILNVVSASVGLSCLDLAPKTTSQPFAQLKDHRQHARTMRSGHPKAYVCPAPLLSFSSP